MGEYDAYMAEQDNKEYYKDTFFSEMDLSKIRFDWKDLDGKTLKINYNSTEEAICVFGKDVKRDTYYLLHFELKTQ